MACSSDFCTAPAYLHNCVTNYTVQSFCSRLERKNPSKRKSVRFNAYNLGYLQMPKVLQGYNFHDLN